MHLDWGLFRPQDQEKGGGAYQGEQRAVWDTVGDCALASLIAAAGPGYERFEYWPHPDRESVRVVQVPTHQLLEGGGRGPDGGGGGDGDGRGRGGSGGEGTGLGTRRQGSLDSSSDGGGRGGGGMERAGSGSMSAARSGSGSGSGGLGGGALQTQGGVPTEGFRGVRRSSDPGGASQQDGEGGGQQPQQPGRVEVRGPDSLQALIGSEGGRLQLARFATRWCMVVGQRSIRVSVSRCVYVIFLCLGADDKVHACLLSPLLYAAF